jgi:D-3-phosphoglycerate dehydrogenase
MKSKVFVASKMNEAGLKKLKSVEDFTVVSIPKPTQEELVKHISDADAISIRSNVKLTADVLEHAKNLKIITRAGSGVDNIDLRKATEKGIPVCNSPGLNSNSVAELVFSYIHALNKNIVPYDSTTKAGGWNKGKYAINELRGKTIGIAGMGAVGRLVLEKARGYHMQVKAGDPFLSTTMAEDLGIELLPDLEKLFKTCDIVTLHMPATPETSGKITRELLCSMKKNAIFVNTARAKLLAPGALEKAMASHKTLRAGIDVILEEKEGKKELAKYSDRLIMTPHIAGSSQECQDGIAEFIADMIIDALTKNKLINLVNFIKIPEELDRAYLDLAESLGQLSGSLAEGKGQIDELRIICYGNLKQYAEILIKPAIKGALSKCIDGNITLINAENKAKELGIKTVMREPDDSKLYGDSITVEVAVRKKNKSSETSTRGKLIEDEPTVIRVNNYQELGINPMGNNLFLEYDNKPGVIGIVATTLGSNSINIESIVARKDTDKGKKQLLTIRTEQAINAGLLIKIVKKVESRSVKVYSANNIQFT